MIDILVLALGPEAEKADPGLVVDPDLEAIQDQTARAQGAGPDPRPGMVPRSPSLTAGHALGLGLR